MIKSTYKTELAHLFARVLPLKEQMMRGLRNYSCITILMLGGSAFCFAMAYNKWGSVDPVLQNIRDMLAALTVASGGLWLTMFAEAWVRANWRLAESLFAARLQSESVLVIRVAGIIAAVVGIWFLVLGLQKALMLLGLAKHP